MHNRISCCRIQLFSLHGGLTLHVPTDSTLILSFSPNQSGFHSPKVRQFGCTFLLQTRVTVHQINRTFNSWRYLLWLESLFGFSRQLRRLFADWLLLLSSFTKDRPWHIFYLSWLWGWFKSIDLFWQPFFALKDFHLVFNCNKFFHHLNCSLLYHV